MQSGDHASSWYCGLDDPFREAGEVCSELRQREAPHGGPRSSQEFSYEYRIRHAVSSATRTGPDRRRASNASMSAGFDPRRGSLFPLPGMPAGAAYYQSHPNIGVSDCVQLHEFIMAALWLLVATPQNAALFVRLTGLSHARDLLSVEAAPLHDVQHLAIGLLWTLVTQVFHQASVTFVCCVFVVSCICVLFAAERRRI